LLINDIGDTYQRYISIIHIDNFDFWPLPLDNKLLNVIYITKERFVKYYIEQSKNFRAVYRTSLENL